jgi:hypothetical protein
VVHVFGVVNHTLNQAINRTKPLNNLRAVMLHDREAHLLPLSSNQVSAIVGKTIPRVHTSKPHIPLKCLFYSNVGVDQPSQDNQIRAHSAWYPLDMTEILQKIYTPRGVESQIKRYGGCFLETTLLCPEMQRTGKFSCTSLCKAELAESQIQFGGWGQFINSVNKCLKMLGFFLYFGKLQSWARQFRLP